LNPDDKRKEAHKKESLIRTEELLADQGGETLSERAEGERAHSEGPGGKWTHIGPVLWKKTKGP